MKIYYKSISEAIVIPILKTPLSKQGFCKSEYPSSVHAKAKFDYTLYYSSELSFGHEHGYHEREWYPDEIAKASEPSMENCTLKMYSRTFFRGTSVQATKNMWNFGQFDDELASLKIEGNCCWELYTDEKFRGDSIILTEGNYGSSTQIKDIFMRASSATQQNTC